MALSVVSGAMRKDSAADGSRASRSASATGESASPAGDVVHRTMWWKEALIVLGFYVAYSLVRNQFGSALVTGTQIPIEAFVNAMRIIRIERALGLYHEESVQDWFEGFPTFLQVMNTYYGLAHFLVTLGVFIALFMRHPAVFALWRNTLAFTTALALVGFALFPVMPPRLLDAPCPPVAEGGACIRSELRTSNDARNFGFVDTIDVHGGPWSFDEGPGKAVSNQYAAMPSLHIGWATWCVFALYPFVRRRAARLALLLYPAVTLFAIVVTGNHFWLDGVGGIAVFVAGRVLGGRLHGWNQARLARLQERGDE